MALVAGEGVVTSGHVGWIQFARAMAPLMARPAQLLADIIAADGRKAGHRTRRNGPDKHASGLHVFRILARLTSRRGAVLSEGEGLKGGRILLQAAQR